MSYFRKSLSSQQQQHQLPLSSASCRIDDKTGKVACDMDGRVRGGHSEGFPGSLATLQHWISYITDTYLVNYWYKDLPPLYGPLRMVFYGLYFLITWQNDLFLFHSRPTRQTFFQDKCYFHLTESIPHYRRLGFEYKREGGIFNWFFLEPGNELLLKLNPYWTCSGLTWMFWSGLVLSCIGLGGKIPRFMVCVSFWMLFGLRNAFFVGESSHSHYLAGMAMTALCFAENNLIDRWSLDWWIVKAFGRFRNKHNNEQQQQPPIRSSGGPSAGSAARKFVLYMAVCSIYFAGMHKFSTWGFKWMDGTAIWKCLDEEHSHNKYLHDIFYENKWLTTMLSIATIIGEIGAFAVLIYPWWRPYGIASFYSFHIGVFLLMQPNFISNMVTYILIMDWRKVFGPLVKNQSICRQGKTSRAAMINTMPFDGHKQQSSKCHDMSSSVPDSWRVGSWMYTVLALVVFVTSVCRIDAFPFFSWSLYNWHPSEPGDQTPYENEAVIKEAAHRCLTKPPFNPACRNHGTTRHHDLFPAAVQEYMYTVTITGVKPNAKQRPEVRQKECPLAIYVNWNPVACEKIQDGVPLRQQLINILALATASDVYDHVSQKNVPKLPAKSIRRTLTRYAVDAVAAAVEEGPKCFAKNATWMEIPDHNPRRWYSSDNNPVNAVSRFSRQLRTHMNKPGNDIHYAGRGREILAVGVALEYLGDFKEVKKKHYKVCMMGGSLAGETVRTSFGNHQVGANERETSKLPPGDWSEVRHEFFLTFLLAMVVYMLPHWKYYLDFTKDTVARGGKTFLMFQIVLLLSCANMFFAVVSINPESKEGIAFAPE